LHIESANDIINILYNSIILYRNFPEKEVNIYDLLNINIGCLFLFNK
jgi:hypothetical protein